MGNAVEHASLNSGVVHHILEDDLLSHPKFVVEQPTAHIIARQTAVATQPIYIRCSADLCHCPLLIPLFKRARTSHHRPVRHLETVGHVTRKTYIQYGGLYALVF